MQFAGLVSPGLFQFNVVVPDPLAAGDQTIRATYGGVTVGAAVKPRAGPIGAKAQHAQS